MDATVRDALLPLLVAGELRVVPSRPLPAGKDSS